MHRIDHPTATVDHKFTKGNPQTAIKPTVITDDWANAVQEEVATFIESRGITLDKTINTQFKQALESAITVYDENVIVSNNQTAVNLGTPFVFDIANIKSAIIECDIYRKDATKEKCLTGFIYIVGNITTGTYQVIENLVGDLDEIGFDLSIAIVSGVGTLKYSTTDFAGANYEGKMTFKIKKLKR